MPQQKRSRWRALGYEMFLLVQAGACRTSPSEPRFGFSSENRPLLLEAESPSDTKLSASPQLPLGKIRQPPAPFPWAPLLSCTLLGLLLLGVSCVVTNQTPKTDIPDTSPLTSEEWLDIQEGVAYRQQQAALGDAIELVHIVRIEPQAAHIRIAVAEENPRSVQQWSEDLDAAVIINGSYFDENYQLVTRTVVDEKAYGILLSGATGVAQEEEDGMWTIQPWSGQAISANTAVQSYPLLVEQGMASFKAGSSDVAQRTLIAVDMQERLYFLLFERGTFSLAQAAEIIVNDLDLNLQTVLNLDGGTSSGLMIDSAEISVLDDSLPVPSVLYVSPSPIMESAVQ